MNLEHFRNRVSEELSRFATKSKKLMFATGTAIFGVLSLSQPADAGCSVFQRGFDMQGCGDPTIRHTRRKYEAPKRVSPKGFEIPDGWSARISRQKPKKREAVKPQIREASLDRYSGINRAGIVPQITPKKKLKSMNEILLGATAQETAHYQMIATDLEYARKPSTRFQLLSGERVKPKSVPNVESPRQYFGGDGYRNKPDTFIDESLYDIVPHTIDDTEAKNVLIYEKNTQTGKYIVRFYMGGKLVLAAYTTPGSNQDGRRTPSRKTIIKVADGTDLFNNSDIRTRLKGPKDAIALQPQDISIHKFHASSKYDASAMIYYFNLWYGVGGHSSREVTGNAGSHGCTRFGLFYAAQLYQWFGEINKRQGEKIKVVFDKLY